MVCFYMSRPLKDVSESFKRGLIGLRPCQDEMKAFDLFKRNGGEEGQKRQLGTENDDIREGIGLLVAATPRPEGCSITCFFAIVFPSEPEDTISQR